MNEQKTRKGKLDKGIFRAVKKDGTVYYRASLTYRGKHISLGSYRDAEQAHSAYEEGIRLLNDSSLSLKSYRETSSLSFEKWSVCSTSGITESTLGIPSIWVSSFFTIISRHTMY